MTANWLKDLRPRTNTVKTFTSYVNFETNENQGDFISSNADVKDDDKLGDLQPKEAAYPSVSLLPGELVIAQAENVLKFNTLSELNKGISGILLCTNFKLSFLTAENFPSNLHQKNILLGEHDICLINIDSVYNVVNGKRKKLTVASVSGNVEIIEIHCKDFRIYTFSFKFSPISQRTVISTIIHHAFALRINLLFAFDYKNISPFSDEKENSSMLFTRPCDWEAELERCKCPGWRVTLANEKFLLCESLPESFVVPSILLDMNLNKTAPHFAGHRVPTWSWGMPSGASIIRMAALDASISDSQQKDVMIDAISRASPRQAPVRMFNLDDLCPSVKDVQNSFLKLKDLCMPTSPDDFWETESRYFTNLESTKWLYHISCCLSTAIEAANCLLEKTTVIFAEHEGRDLSAILSCLVQIILDPSYRTITGFELLIQKEWIALGHPFTERNHLVTGFESEESPVFLLFLDCVWQLSEQCPTVFEFSETYLTSLWDSCHVSLFDSFIFSSHKNRIEAFLNYSTSSNFRLRSVFIWEKQFTGNDLRLFHNPLYILNQYATRDTSAQRTFSHSERPRSFSCLTDAAHSQSRPLLLRKRETVCVLWDSNEENLLKIDPNIKSLKLWHQCYLRWIPLAHVLGGGSPVLFLNNLKVSAEIEALEKSIKSLSMQSKQQRNSSRHRRVASDDYTISAEAIDVQDSSSIITSVFPFSPVAPWDWTSYHCVPMTSCLQISYSETDGNLED